MATKDRVSTVQARLLGQDVSYSVSGAWLSYWLVLMRMVAGWWLLHAGLDKLVNWPFDASWFVGGAAQGTSLDPFVALFSDGVLLTFVNISIPLGQTLIGLGLILGALTRTAAFFGAVLMLFCHQRRNGRLGTRCRHAVLSASPWLCDSTLVRCVSGSR